MHSSASSPQVNAASLHGALLIDKPMGITSAKVLRRLERMLPGARLGHSGTLDPDATGLLVVLVGKASRLQEIFLGGDKRYSGTILLGRETSTDDISGETVQEDPDRRWLAEGPLEAQLDRLRTRFTGTLMQRPPAISAIKIDGERSYRRARRGETVSIGEREVRVHELALTVSGEDLLEYDVRCSKGFYVRSLARDVGRELGSFGCLASIRRTESSPFSISSAVTLEELEQGGLTERLIPMEKLTSALPQVMVSEEQYLRLLQGDQSPLLGQPVWDGGKVVALSGPGGRFCGLLEYDGGALRIRFLMPAEGRE